MKLKCASLRARLGDAVLGAPGAQRRRAAYSLLALVVYAGFAVMQQVEVWNGLIDQTESNRLTLYNLAGALAWFGLVRSGRNLRFSDPSLTFQQCLFGVTAICFSYAITGPARGGIMSIMLLILAFAMFSLKPEKIRRLSLFAFALLASVMVWKATTDPLRYAPSVELTHALLAMILMTSIAVLSLRMGALRERLLQQKAELAHTLEQNRRLATLDELTGLVNRRHMGATLHAEHERQRRGSEPLSIGLIDIDLFKRVNDLYGHAAGDTVLREFSRLAVKTLRSCDVAARWGGEEFLILMPGTRGEDAVLVIDRLRQDFSMLQFPGIDAQLRATFSAGVAEHDEFESVDTLVERADQSMYAAKASGRNRVRTETDPDHPPFAPTQAPLDFLSTR